MTSPATSQRDDPSLKFPRARAVSPSFTSHLALLLHQSWAMVWQLAVHGLGPRSSCSDGSITLLLLHKPLLPSTPSFSISHGLPTAQEKPKRGRDMCSSRQKSPFPAALRGTRLQEIPPRYPLSSLSGLPTPAGLVGFLQQGDF